MRPTPHTTLQNHFEIYFWLARNFLQGLFVLNTFCILYPQTTVPFPQTSKMTHACLSSNTDTFPSFSKQNKIKQHTKKKQTSNNNKTKQKKILVLCFLSAQRKKSECQDKPTDGCWFFLMPASGHQGHTLNYISGVLFSVAAAVLPENASATFKLLQDMRPLVSPKECCPIRTDSDVTNANSGSGFQVLHNLGKKKSLEAGFSHSHHKWRPCVS